MKTRWPIQRNSPSNQRKISFHKIDHHENQVAYSAQSVLRNRGQISFHKIDHHENQVAYSAQQCFETEDNFSVKQCYHLHYVHLSWSLTFLFAVLSFRAVSAVVPVARAGPCLSFQHLERMMKNLCDDLVFTAIGTSVPEHEWVPGRLTVFNPCCNCCKCQVRCGGHRWRRRWGRQRVHVRLTPQMSGHLQVKVVRVTSTRVKGRPAGAPVDVVAPFGLTHLPLLASSPLLSRLLLARLVWSPLWVLAPALLAVLVPPLPA